MAATGVAARRPGRGGTGVPERRICVLGDALVAGFGDPKSLGWVGRVAARTPGEDAVLSVFPLAVPGETTSALAERWWQECSLRFDGPAAGAVDRRLVLGLGHADVLAGKSVARCRLNLANLLDDAHSRRLPAFVVGPPPTADRQLNEQVEEYARTLGDACRRRDVPFVDTYTPLVRHEDWLTDLAAGDGVHPRQAGYGLLAWLVLHGGWYEWLGVPRP